MNIINKLLPKDIVETNIKRLSRFFDLTKDPFVPLENPDESDQIEAEKSAIPYDHWFDDNPRAEEEVADNMTLHEKMYKIATDKNNPFSIGGSEEWHDSKPG